MTEIFTGDGHLTDEALQRLIDGTLDETGRMEAAEHLSFCDACTARYTALLTEDVLCTPERDQTLSIMRTLAKRRRKSAVRRYAAAAAAFILSSVLWYTGTFELVGKTIGTGFPLPELPHRETAAEQQKNDFGSGMLKAADKWSKQILEFAQPAFRMPPQENQNRSNDNNTEEIER